MKDLCARCTICCYYKKLRDDGTVVYTDRPCEYLDLDSGLCIIYENRTKMKEDCVRITRRVIGMGALPSGCPYVAREKNYRGPKLTKRLRKMAEAAFGDPAKKGR
ncbi:MAG: hypothetical protein GXP58_09965 [Deltaproteobacteria bacterium]|nr:hypothetical protein [Deltaproteobacteria bacterium]